MSDLFFNTSAQPQKQFLPMEAYVWLDSDKQRSISQISVQIPQSIIDSVRGAPNQGIFDVNRITEYKERILKCNDIVFSPRSRLVLDALTDQTEPVIIAARRWRFLGAENEGTISRKIDIYPSNGVNGANGAPGNSPTEQPLHGGPGGVGGAGQAGQTIRLAPLFLFGDEMINQSDIPIDYSRLKIFVDGFDGGRGGRGGNGGKGGDGRKGSPASCGLQWCNAGPGTGGNAGRGGNGGDGGQGGDGSNGGSVIGAGSERFLEPLSFAQVGNLGGKGQPGGDAGQGGSAGSRGPGGNGCVFCGGGGNGSDGSDSSPGVNGRNGARGTDGLKGTREVAVFDISTLY